MYSMQGKPYIKRCPCRCEKHEGKNLSDIMGYFVAYVCECCEDDIKDKYHPSTWNDSTEYKQRSLEFGERLEPDDL